MIIRKLLILINDKNAQIVPSADLRYTAGTRATNSLVATACFAPADRRDSRGVTHGRPPKAKRSEIAKKAVAKRWGKKRHRSGGALDAVSRGDTQSFAHRSEGDTKDAATRRPTIPSETGGASPDGIAIARDLYTESQRLRQQLLRQQLAQIQITAGGQEPFHYHPVRCQL